MNQESTIAMDRATERWIIITIICVGMLAFGQVIFSWNSFVNVSSNIGTSYHPSIAVDGANTIHMVWTDNTLTYPNNDEILYKKSTDGGMTWSSVQNLSNTATSSSSPVIAAAPSGALAVAWVESGRPMVRIWNGNAWNIATQIAASTTPVERLSVTINQSGIVLVAWSLGYGSEIYGTGLPSSSYFYSRWDGTAWAVPTSMMGRLVTMRGNLAYLVRSDRKLLRSDDAGASWATQVDLPALYIVPDDMKIDSQGKLHMAWYVDKGIQAATYDGQTFSDVKPISTWTLNNPFRRMGIAINGSDQVALIWTETSREGDDNSTFIRSTFRVMASQSTDGIAWTAPVQVGSSGACSSAIAGAATGTTFYGVVQSPDCGSGNAPDVYVAFQDGVNVPTSSPTPAATRTRTPTATRTPTTSVTPTPIPVDLSIVSAIPVQTLEEIGLIQGKDTAIKVTIRKQGKRILDNVSVRVSTTNFSTGRFYVAEPTNIDDNSILKEDNSVYPLKFGEQDEEKTIYVFGFSAPESPFKVSVSVDDLNQIAETSENNNTLSSAEYTLLDKKWSGTFFSDFNLRYILVDWPDTNDDSFKKFYDYSNSFIQGVYPISSGRLKPDYSQDTKLDTTWYRGLNGRLSDRELRLWFMATIQGQKLAHPTTDRFIGVTPSGWFHTQTLMPNIGGIAYPGMPELVVAEARTFSRPNGVSIVAHEIGHSYGLHRDPEEYTPSYIGNFAAKGMWVEKRMLIESTSSYPVYCFMGSGEKPELGRWIDLNDYAGLYNYQPFLLSVRDSQKINEPQLWYTPHTL